MADPVDETKQKQSHSAERGPARSGSPGDPTVTPVDTENSIRPARRRTKSPTPAVSPKEPAQKPTESLLAAPERKGRSTTKHGPVPEHIHRRFVAVGHRYYFSDGAHAFTDRGSRLTTQSENTEVIKSLIAIAETRGWTEITVSGTERFRRDAWIAANVAGLSVRGYRPTEFERAQLARTIARERGRGDDPREPPAGDRSSPDRDAVRAEGTPQSYRFIAGRLVEHGAAPYRNDPHERMSYFVKLETPTGIREVWGVDLQRALKESLTDPKVGDEVGLRAVRREAVKVAVAERDETGAVVREAPLETHRNRWIIEKQEFFADRAAAARTVRDATVNPKDGARKHPELVGTYLQMRAAELASKQFRDPEDRKTFVSRVRAALADRIARGEPLPPVQLKAHLPPTKAPPVPADPVR